MSISWTRDRASVYCGFCGKAITPGFPIFEIAIGGKKCSKPLVKRRCEVCAWEPVPWDLAPLPPREAVTPTPTQPRRMRATTADLTRDYKLKQSGAHD